MLNIAEEIANKQIEEGIKSVDDKVKKEYMERIWNMEKAEIFHELMRVHGESAKLLMEAHEELASKISSLEGSSSISIFFT